MTQELEGTLLYYQEHWRAYRHEVPRRYPDWNRWLARAAAQMPADRKRILEIGSGTGIDADYLEQLGYVVDRTDATPAFVEALRAGGKHAGRLDIVRDVACAADYGMVLACAVLHHLSFPELQCALRNMHASLPGAGIVAYTARRTDRAGCGDHSEHREDGRLFFYREPGTLWGVTETAGFIMQTMEFADYGPVKEPGKPYGQWLRVIARKEVPDDLRRV